MMQAGVSGILEVIRGTWPLLVGTIGFAAWYMGVARIASRETRRHR